MTPLLLAIVLFVVGLFTVFTGLFWITVPLLVLSLLALVWAVVVFARGDGLPVMHRTRKPELLGPGGPDDPDADA